jgi:hypothetical protein
MQIFEGFEFLNNEVAPKSAKMIFNAFLPLIRQPADEVIENQRSL